MYGIDEIDCELDSMDTERLTALRDKINVLLTQGRHKPKWPGGKTLWHKVWRKTVRCIYEDDYRVRCWWDVPSGEWNYQDKYTGDPMAESDLEILGEQDKGEFDDPHEDTIIAT